MRKEDFDIIPKLEGKDRPVCTVVFCADDAYAALVGVALVSMLQNVSDKIFCDIVILENEISDENRERILETVEPYIHSAVRFCNIAHKISGISDGKHISNTTYLRLFIPFLFRGHEKVLYLDGDILIQKDTATL